VGVHCLEINLETHFLGGNGVLLFTTMDKYKELQSHIETLEKQECCLLCGKQGGLQGVAITVGRRTFHLFYLCDKCGNISIEELLRIVKSYKKYRKE
jgi:hypothetical protein